MNSPSLIGHGRCSPEICGSDLQTALRTLGQGDSAMAKRVGRWLFLTVTGKSPSERYGYTAEQYRKIGEVFDALLVAVHGSPPGAA